MRLSVLRCTALATALLASLSPGASALDLGPVPRQAAAASRLPPHWQHGAFMEVFVRAYQDSDGDGIGDLRGLTQRLPYLKALGISGIWLMPITASSDRDHGYATTDFRALEPQYGSLADFDALIREAHRLGIGVIADYVINHASAKHPLFVQAQNKRKSRYRDWFVWADPQQPQHIQGWDIWGKNPWYDGPGGSYFATFGPHMPDFNLRHKPALDYHLASLRFWLNRGLDGFRLDAVPHLIENSAKDWNDQPESRRLNKRLQDEIKRYPGRYVVCEATANPQVYARPEVCGSAFAFGLEQHIIEAARGQKSEAVQAVADYYASAPPSMATMLANHDIFAGRRIWDQFYGDERRYRLAAASYLLQPGTPFIYYGEEIGMAGLSALPGDEPLRGPMSWRAEGGFSSAKPFRPAAPNARSRNAQDQQADPGSLLNFYKAMLKLRNGLPALARGSYERARVDGLVWSFQRRLGGELCLVLINYGPQSATVQAQDLPPEAALLPHYPANQASLRSDAGGRVALTLPGQSLAVFRILTH